MRPVSVILAVALFLSGCMHRPLPYLSEEDRLQLLTPIECSEPAECDLLWRKAQVWVATNAGFKIQVISSVIIETYSSSNDSFRWAARVIRRPISTSRSEIEVDFSCGAANLCRPDAERLTISFKQYLRRAL